VGGGELPICFGVVFVAAVLGAVSNDVEMRLGDISGG
jgi:hypothetical protein